MVEIVQHRQGTPSVRVEVCNTHQAHYQCGHGRAVSSSGCSTDLSHHWYGGGTLSVNTGEFSTEEAHHQYGRGCGVQDYQNCSGRLLAVVFL